MKLGARVVLNYSGDKASADATVEALGGSAHAIAVQANAGTLEGIDTMIAATVSAFGKIDVLICNAATMPMKTVETTTEADFDSIFALNVKGPYFLVQKALPHMTAGGRVIFVSTSVIHASQLSPPYTLYGATKGAIEQMTHSFAKTLGARGITVNAVAPGPTGTELFLKGKSPELIDSIAKFSPFGRIGEPDEVADVFIFLASEASRWVSGQVILVNGGFSFQ